MTGYEELGRVVSGDSGQPVRTSVNGSIETNNYQTGSGFDFDGNAYPYTVDPAFQGEVCQITSSGDIEAEFTTISGDIVTIPLAGGTGVIDWISFDSITFKDPKAVGTRIAGSVGGEI